MSAGYRVCFALWFVYHQSETKTLGPGAQFKSGGRLYYYSFVRVHGVPLVTVQSLRNRLSRNYFYHIRARRVLFYCFQYSSRTVRVNNIAENVQTDRGAVRRHYYFNNIRLQRRVPDRRSRGSAVGRVHRPHQFRAESMGGTY